MTANDNERPWESTYRFLHPKLTYLPDLGVHFPPEDEANFRRKAEWYGLDYDLIKEQFAMSTQVIPPRPRKLAMEFIRKGAIPQNALSNYFEGYLNAKVARAREQQKQNV